MGLEKHASIKQSGRKPRIVTNASELRRICMSQPKISLEKARRSVMAGVSLGRMDGKGDIR